MMNIKIYITANWKHILLHGVLHVLLQPQHVSAWHPENIIKLELLSLMGPVKLQFESISVSVIDSLVTWCNLTLNISGVKRPRDEFCSNISNLWFYLIKVSARNTFWQKLSIFLSRLWVALCLFVCFSCDIKKATCRNSIHSEQGELASSFWGSVLYRSPREQSGVKCLEMSLPGEEKRNSHSLSPHILYFHWQSGGDLKWQPSGHTCAF